MDNNTYETYEYLPANNSETEPNQFFVVQDDGTFLINRHVQCVTQVQDEKEAIDGEQSCTVYDITPQQFYVDVDNSTELISVPENLILPDGTSNLYANSYLLQTISTTNSDQVKEEEVTQYRETDVLKIILGDNESNQASHCTEITLNDELYNMLEQKGWVLLETSEKIFILDTLGLHDITNNQELIEKLKNENPNVHTLVDSRSIIKLDNASSTIKFESIATKNTASEQDTVEYVIANEDVDVVQNIDSASKVSSMELSNAEDMDEMKQKENKTKNIEEKETDNERKHQKERQTIKIKTKCTFKDIPDKIVLGKTVNGKHLVAKVIRSKKRDAKKCDSDNNNQTQPENRQKSTKDVCESEQTHLIDWQFDSLVQQILHNGVPQCSPEHVATAQVAINQLLQVPAFQLAVVDRNLFITKLVKNKLENVEFHVQSETIAPTIVTGRVESLNEGKRFVHIPDLLQKLKAESEKANTEKRLADPNSDEFSVLHVHITETKTAGSTEGFSINLNKRQLPFMPTKNTPSKRQCSKVYACSSCAKVFQTELELLEHQENHCMESDYALTIDTDKIDDDKDTKINDFKINPYYIIKSTKGSEYACLHCFLRFKKLSNCQRHIKTHSNAVNAKDTEISGKAKLLPTYKCKMCPSSYYHSSTLSKHIVAAHISKTELNKQIFK